MKAAVKEGDAASLTDGKLVAAREALFEEERKTAVCEALRTAVEISTPFDANMIAGLTLHSNGCAGEPSDGCCSNRDDLDDDLEERERALSDARSKLEQATQQVVQQIDSVGNIVGNAAVASPDEAAGPTCLTGAGRELQVRVSKRRCPLPQQGVVQREALTRVGALKAAVKEGDAAGLTDGKPQQAQSMALEAQVEAKLGAEAEANAKSQTEAEKKAKTAAGMKKKAARQVKIAQVTETKAKAEIDAELKIMRVKQPQTAEETDMKIAVASDIVIEVTDKTAVKASGSKKATGSAAQSPDLVTPLRRVEEESDDSDDPPLRFPV